MRATVQCVYIYITLGLVFITSLNFRPRLVSVYSPHFGSAEAPAIYAFNENLSAATFYKALPAATSARCCCCCCRCCRYALRAFPEFPSPRSDVVYIILLSCTYAAAERWTPRRFSRRLGVFFIVCKRTVIGCQFVFPSKYTPCDCIGMTYIHMDTRLLFVSRREKRAI